MSNTAISGQGGALPAAPPTRRNFLRTVAAAPVLAVPAIAAAADTMPTPYSCPDLALIQATVGWQIHRLAYDGLPPHWPKEKVDRHWNKLCDLEAQIATCPATTLAGVTSKATVLRRLMEINEDVYPVELGSVLDLTFSILDDLDRADHDDALLTTAPDA